MGAEKFDCANGVVVFVGMNGAGPFLGTNPVDVGLKGFADVVKAFCRAVRPGDDGAKPPRVGLEFVLEAEVLQSLIEDCPRATSESSDSGADFEFCSLILF